MGEVAKHSDVDRRQLMKRAAGPIRALGEPDEREATASSLHRRVGRARAMRPSGPTPPRRSTKAVPAPPPAAYVALNRMGFGHRIGDVAAFDALGGNDQERMLAYVNLQTYPYLIDDSDFAARVTAAGFTTLWKSLAQLWADHIESGPPWSVRMRPFYEVERMAFLRAVYSKRQLVEVLADFWHNHFSVQGWDSWIAPIFPHWDRDVIRANIFGNFRTMLEAVATSPVMLYYLDNYTSSNAGPNENFARELIELHTLGAENYLGVMRQSDVPLDSEGRPIGYVDDDVFEAVRCFTGWSFDFDTGLFTYRGDWHDHFQKTVLGTYMPPNQPDLQDGRDALDALASHPGTARYITRKLCRRLVSDNPPQSLVDQAAAVFIAKKDEQDQLRSVVRTILLSNEFLSTWGEKIKRPFEIAVSAMRSTSAEFTFSLSEGDTDTFLYRYEVCGQPLFQWPAPNGYPDSREDWQAANPRVGAWRLGNWLIDVEDDTGTHRLNVLGQTSSSARSANELADFWIQRVFARPLPAVERQEIVDFMAQGHNPDFDLPLDTDEDTRDRLRMMVSLLFMTPSFLWR